MTTKVTAPKPHRHTFIMWGIGIIVAIALSAAGIYWKSTPAFSQGGRGGQSPLGVSGGDGGAGTSAGGGGAAGKCVKRNNGLGDYLECEGGAGGGGGGINTGGDGGSTSSAEGGKGGR
jgi:hypothetical protein